MSDERLPDGRLMWEFIGNGRYGTGVYWCNICGNGFYEQHMERHERSKGHQRLLAKLREKSEKGKP